YLIDNGVSASSRDNYGFTALHWACRSSAFCQIGIIEFLVARGADPHAQNITGLTPLHLAAFYSRNIEALQCLLELGTNNLLGVASRGRMTPLHWAVGRPTRRDTEGEDSTKAVIEFLLRRGADIRAQNLRGITPLEW
ncbi:ankyrin repeat-containing domain protein, partial [Thelonectria olida]